MSSRDRQAALTRAYELVEAGQNEEAQAILEPILAEDRNNADAWWIYAHAVTTPEEGRRALERVLSINPNYPGAAELLEMAREELAEEVPPPKIAQLSSQAPPSLPDDFPEFGREPARASRRAPQAGSRNVLPLLIVAAIIVVVVVALLLSQTSGTTPPATAAPTELVAVIVTSTPNPAQIATEEMTLLAELTPEALATGAMLPTTEPTSEATSEVLPTEAASNEFAALAEALAEFPVAENGIEEGESSFGNTVFVRVCSASGREMRSMLPLVMNAVAEASPSLDAEALGVRMIDCEQDTEILSIAIDSESARSYADGDLTDAEFAALWQRQ
jgi:hypothetical protein